MQPRHVAIVAALSALIGAAQAVAGHLITQDELQKSCGPLIPAARQERVDYFKSFLAMFPGDKEARAGLARAMNPKLSNEDWYINWAHLGPGFAGMTDGADADWLNKGRDPEVFRKVVDRLSGSEHARTGNPMTLAGICAMRAHMAALEGASMSDIVRMADRAGVSALATDKPAAKRASRRDGGKTSDDACAKTQIVNGKKFCIE